MEYEGWRPVPMAAGARRQDEDGEEDEKEGEDEGEDVTVTSVGWLQHARALANGFILINYKHNQCFCAKRDSLEFKVQSSLFAP